LKNINLVQQSKEPGHWRNNNWTHRNWKTTTDRDH